MENVDFQFWDNKYYLFINLFIYLSIYIAIYLLTHSFIHSFVYLFVCLSISRHFFYNLVVKAHCSNRSGVHINEFE